MGTKTKVKNQDKTEKKFDEEEQNDKKIANARLEQLKQKGLNARDDIQNLKKAHDTVPNSEKQLAACTICRLVLSSSQWDKLYQKSKKQDIPECPNKCVNPIQTRLFSGMISMFMPSQSWVARRNGLQNSIPGIYAISARLEDDYNDIQDEKPSKRQKKQRGNGDNWDSDDQYSSS